VRATFLPPFRHTIGEEEINEVVDTLKSDWITTGPKTRKFEELFQRFIGSRHAIAVNSCTAALHLSLAACGVEKGDEVITTPFTFASTVEVIIHQNAKPVLVDIEDETYNIDVSSIAGTITRKTKAIVPVHYAGHPCEMDGIAEIASDHKLAVIEDAAHALGSSYNGRSIGTIGDATCFSFYATKNLTTGEGGAVTTNDAHIAKRIALMSLHGISKDAWKRYSSEGTWYYEILCPGYKYNMADVQAALGIRQLLKLENMQARREHIARLYNSAFEKRFEIRTPTVKKGVKHAWHLYPILLEPDLLKVDRATFVEALRSENVGTSVHFIPIHLHPYYRDRYKFKCGDFPIAESVYNNEISLPIYPRMSDDDVADVVTAVEKVADFYAV
jgi:dTDP-4-amino-4,6-dideoxygalactose transaminase